MEKQPLKGDLKQAPVTNLVLALGLGALGVAIAAAGITIGETDDAPGAALLGFLLMIGLVALGVKWPDMVRLGPIRRSRHLSAHLLSVPYFGGK